MRYHILETFRRLPRVKVVCVLFMSLPLFLTGSLQAAGQSEASEIDYTLLSLEELVNIEIVSAAKKSQKLSDTSAAVYVITQEDIQRSGVQSIPDALRMVPGLQVARIDANKWAITARGFNDRFSNKLLVLVDGRSVYTHLFSGVLWSTLDTLLEDIEQIEVIRGPGATMWGANAVNGVINIITKKASSTQGGLMSVGTGTEERLSGAVRYGGKLNTDTHYRIYAKYFDRDAGTDISGMEGRDEWKMYRTGFRMDWEDSASIHGEIFRSDTGSKISYPVLFSPYYQRDEEEILSTGGHIVGRYQKNLSGDSLISIQFYYDRTNYDLFHVNTSVDTMDLELNHRFRIGSRHDLVWGIGARYIQDDLETLTPLFQIDDGSRDTTLISGFVQDDIGFLDNRLRITLGSKFEHNDYTGFEWQPNIRFSWSPEEPYSVWGAVSHAVRTPSRMENDLQLTVGTFPEGTFLPYYPGPGFSTVVGNDSYDSENLTALEAGIRAQLRNNLSIDLAVYYNIFENLRGGRAGEPYFDMSGEYPAMIVPAEIKNVMEGRSYGIELALDWFISETWKLKGSYTLLELDLDLSDRLADTGQVKIDEGSSPEHQASLQSMVNLPGGFTFDVWCRFVDGLVSEEVDSYITADIRLGWQVNKNIELSLTGQNLVGSSRVEFIPQVLNTIPTEMEPSVYGKFIWRF